MPRDVTPELGAALNGLVVTHGGRTLTFRYLPWGRHWDQNQWPDNASESVVSVVPVAKPTENRDIGSGASHTLALMDVHLWWNDDHSYTGGATAETFKRAVEDAVIAAIRAVELSVGVSLYTQVRNVVDRTDLLGEGTTILAYHVIVSFESFVQETY